MSEKTRTIRRRGGSNRFRELADAEVGGPFVPVAAVLVLQPIDRLAAGEALVIDRPGTQLLNEASHAHHLALVPDEPGPSEIEWPDFWTGLAADDEPVNRISILAEAPGAFTDPSGGAGQSPLPSDSECGEVDGAEQQRFD